MRLCGKCGELGYPTYTGLCPNCKEYHGEWYDGFKSLAELEAWRAANVPAETREAFRKWREEREQAIRASDRELAVSLGVSNVEAFVDLASGTKAKVT